MPSLPDLVFRRHACERAALHIDKEGLEQALAHLQGIAIGCKDVQYLLDIPSDVLERRPGVQRGRRSKILALSGRASVSSMQHLIGLVSLPRYPGLKMKLDCIPETDWQ